MESVYLTPELRKLYPFFSQGNAVIKSVVSEEKDKFLAVASLAELGKYIPNIDTAKNVDLLGIAFNIFVANRVNKNDDVCDSKTAVAIAKLFINKPINVEHKRDKVVGVATNYAFTQFGSNKPLTEEEALATSDPFNVTLGGIVWRVVNQKLAKLIEECSDPTSEHYEKISASWEVGFLDFAIASVDGESKNLSDAEIITSQDDIKTLKGYMKAFGGKGFKGEKKLYRLIQGDALPLGTGLTGSPAGEVLGVATEETTNEEKEKEKEMLGETSIAAKIDKDTENISQNKEIVVIQERKALAMSVKITKLEDITDDLLKQATASEITEWVKSQMKLADESYQSEKTQLETQIKASKEASDKLQADQAKLQEDLKKVNESLAALQSEKEARVKQDAFNTRMAGLDKDFTLSDAEREVIAKNIANHDETAFAAYRKELDVLLAAKKKGACGKCKKATAECKCEQEEEMDAKKCKAKASEENKEQQEAKASTEDKKQAVEKALENAEKTNEQLAAAASAQEPTLLDKYAKAFGVDQWISDIKLTE